MTTSLHHHHQGIFSSSLPFFLFFATSYHFSDVKIKTRLKRKEEKTFAKKLKDKIAAEPSIFSQSNLLHIEQTMH